MDNFHRTKFVEHFLNELEMEFQIFIYTITNQVNKGQITANDNVLYNMTSVEWARKIRDLNTGQKRVESHAV